MELERCQGEVLGADHYLFEVIQTVTTHDFPFSGFASEQKYAAVGDHDVHPLALHFIVEDKHVVCHTEPFRVLISVVSNGLDHLDVVTGIEVVLSEGKWNGGVLLGVLKPFYYHCDFPLVDYND